MTTIRIQFSLFSAFYAPLIATITGDFLRDEGLSADWSVAKPGVGAVEALQSGEVDVVQTTVTRSFEALEAGQPLQARHFAVVNEMDGFFLTGRSPDLDFSWSKLEGADVVVFQGGQPLAMFKYACHKAGIDFTRINLIQPGTPADMDRVFREGTGDYVQQQGPFPQQLEIDGLGHVVAAEGPMVGRCAFSSLAGMPDWLAGETARKFTAAYRKARAFVAREPAAQVAHSMKSLFEATDERALAACIAAYQEIGCWSSGIEITPAGYDAMLDVYQYNALISQRHPYDSVVSAPPAA